MNNCNLRLSDKSSGVKKYNIYHRYVVEEKYNLHKTDEWKYKHLKLVLSPLDLLIEM